MKADSSSSSCLAARQWAGGRNVLADASAWDCHLEGVARGEGESGIIHSSIVECVPSGASMVS